MKVVIIDNYDSFTYNLFQYIALLGHEVSVVRNDVVTVEDIEGMNCQVVVISPGPGTPDEAGISKSVIRQFAGQIPILGVCLGHQAIGEVFGGRVVRAPEPVHGKVSLIKHNGCGVFSGLAQNIEAGRYHSLVVAKEGLPDCLEITATSADGLIMGLKHKEFKIEGVQFHPESVLTPEGMKLLDNFLKQV